MRHAERNGVERRRVRSDEIQLTDNRYRLAPLSGHRILFPVIPFPSVVEVFIPKTVT